MSADCLLSPTQLVALTAQVQQLQRFQVEKASNEVAHTAVADQVVWSNVRESGRKCGVHRRGL